jgi:hypothetical protein
MDSRLEDLLLRLERGRRHPEEREERQQRRHDEKDVEDPDSHACGQ